MPEPTDRRWTDTDRELVANAYHWADSRKCAPDNCPGALECCHAEHLLLSGFAAVLDALAAAGRIADPQDAAELRLLRDRDKALSVEADISNRLNAENRELRAELEQIRGQRICSLVFAHHRDAPRPFGLYRRTDVTGVSGTGLVAEGAAFSDGTAVLRWLSDWPTSVVFHDRGMEAIEAVHGHGGATEVVWLSDELEPLAEMEQERDELRARVAKLEQALHETANLAATTPVDEPTTAVDRLGDIVRRAQQAIRDRWRVSATQMAAGYQPPSMSLERPGRWELPAPPGPEVTEVWDVEGVQWTRQHPGVDRWHCDEDATWESVRTWGALLPRGPLSATPPETAGGGQP